MLSNDFKQKTSTIFYCEFCDYATSRRSNMNNHNSTAKHQKSMVGNDFKQKTSTVYNCKLCNKTYKDNSGLWRHNNKCHFVNKEDESEKPDVIEMLIKENSDFKNIILEIVKTVQPINTTNNTNNNNTTNNFNLQFFLNDTCKDAINLVDFVNSLQVKLKDLEETAVLGYSEGVSRIFINGLNALDINKRPIHCSDAKRETLYIKEHNEWTKEDSDKTHLSQAIKTVGKKNIQQIFEWQKKYPDYNDPSSRDSDRYMKMICNTMSGSTQEEQSKNLDKIIKNITKQVVIDKKPLE